MSLTITNQQLKDPLLLRKALEHQKSRYGFKDLVQSNLLRACKLGGLTNSVEVLLSFGATPDGYNAPVKEPLYLQNINTASTPLQYCVINDDRKSVELLLSQKADPNLRGTTGTGKDDDVHLNLPPLHLATRHGHRSMVEILLRAGGSQSPLPETGEYPVHIAAREGHVHLINLFCTSDKSWVNKKTERPALSTDSSFTSKTSLLISVEHAHLECVLLLINQFNADVNIKGINDNNPLHLLLLNSPRDQDDSNARYAIALALLKTDIDLNCENSDGLTPLNLAANNGFPKIAQLLFASKGISSTTNRKRDESEDLDDERQEVSQKKNMKSMEEMKSKLNVSKPNVEINKLPTTPSYFDPKRHREPNLDNEEKLEEVSQKKKPMEETKSKENVSKPNVEINKLPKTPSYFDPKRHREPNLDNEISSFSISTKDGSERMYISFDKNQTPKSTTSQTNNISKKPGTQSMQTEPIQVPSEIPIKVVTVTDPEIGPKSKSESASISEPMLRSRVHTTKVVTVLKETTFWKSQQGDQLNQFFYTPKPDNSQEIDAGSPVFDLHKTFFPSRQFHRSSSPLSFLSEGNRRGLRMRVSGKVPKAYNKNDMDSARKEFFLHPPIGIESIFESADRTHLSIVSLPDLHSKDEVWLKSIQRRMQWLETFKKLKSPSDLKIGPHGKYLPYSFNSKFKGRPKVKGQLIGFLPTPYKSFGPIETKTDALDEAMEDISDFEDDNWDIRNSYQEHYPITNWVKNDGQKICPIEVDDEFLYPDRHHNGWISDDDRDPKRSSCCSIKIDDVMNIVQIADIDDNKKIKEGSSHPSQNDTRESDLDQNKNKQSKPDAATSVVASFRPDTQQNDTFQLVNVDADDENKQNLGTHQDNLIPDQAQQLSPQLPSNKGKLVKKKTQKDVVHTITVEFIKDPEPHTKDEDTNQKIVNDSSKEQVTRKPSKERSSDGKPPKKSSNTPGDQIKGGMNIVQIGDSSDPKKKRKAEDNIGIRATDDKTEKLFPSMIKTINPITDSENVKKPVSVKIDNLNDKDKDGIAVEDGITDGNIQQPQTDISSAKTSKPKSNAHGAQCVRVKKKTRPTIHNVVNPPDNWTQSVIDRLFLSDKWKDDDNQDINNEISSYPELDANNKGGGIDTINVIRNSEEHESGFKKLDKPQEISDQIEAQDEKESNIDDPETIQGLPKVNDGVKKKKRISHDFERSPSKDETKQEASKGFDSTSEKKAKRTTKEKEDASSNGTRLKDSKTIPKEEIFQPTPSDVKHEDNQAAEVGGNDDNILENVDEKVKRKDSRKKGKTEKTVTIKTPEDIDKTPTNEKDELGDKVQPADDSMPLADDKNKADIEIVEPRRPPKRKGSVKKKKEADDDFKIDANKDIDSFLKESTEIRSDDPSDGAKNRNHESTHSEDLYLPMSNITTKYDKAKHNVKTIIDRENNEDIPEDNYYINEKAKFKRKDSKRKTKLDRSASVEPESSYKPIQKDGDGVAASEDNNMDQDAEKNSVIKKKRGDSKRKTKVDKSHSLERDHYLPTPNDVEFEGGTKKDETKRKTKTSKNGSAQQQILNEKQTDETVEYLKPPYDVNNLDVLIPVDPISLDDKSSTTSKKDGKSSKINTEDKSSLEQIVDVPQEITGPQKEDSSKPSTTSQVKDSEESSSHQYYNIIDKSTKDDNKVKQKSKETSLDDYADEDKSKRNIKDGDKLNRSRETNVDDIFQVTTEEDKTETIDDKKSRKTRRREKKGEATHKNEEFMEPPENSEKFLSPSAKENVVRDENAFSDSDFNSSDPDTSHYVEYHVNLGPDYTGNSRIKKSKTMDSTVKFNEDKDDFENKDLEDERKRITEGETENTKIKIEPKKSRKKSRKSGEHLGPTVQSTTTETITETTEILDQESREKQKKKTKIPKTPETTQNEKSSNDDLRQQTDSHEQKPQHKIDKRIQKDRSCDHSLETNNDEVTVDRHETTNNNIIIKEDNSEELNNIGKKKKVKTKPSLKQSDHIETSISQSVETYENHRNKFIDDGSIETKLDDQEFDEKYFKDKQNKEDDASEIAEITKTVIDDDETPENNAARVKKKRSKYGKETDLIEYTTTVVEDVIEFDEGGLKKRIKKDKVEKKSDIPESDQKIKDPIRTSDEVLDEQVEQVESLDDERIRRRKSKMKKKKGEHSYLEETVTTTTTLDDEWRSKQQEEIEESNLVEDEKMKSYSEKDRKMKDSSPTRGEDEKMTNDKDEEGIGRRKVKKKKGQDSYLEETVTTMTILDDKWGSKQQEEIEESNLVEDEKVKGFSEKDRKINDSSPTRGEDEKMTNETSLDEESIGRRKVKKKKGQDSYSEETVTTTVEDKRKSKGRRQEKKETDLKEIEKITDTSGDKGKQKIIQYEMMDDEEEGYEDDAKSKSKKERTQDDFLEEATTTIMDDRWKSKHRERDKSSNGNSNESSFDKTGKVRRQKESAITPREGEEMMDEEADDYGKDYKQSESKKNAKNGYLEEVTTTTTIFEDKWKSKQRNGDKSRDEEKDEKTKQFIETDFDCQEPLPPSSNFGSPDDQKDVTHGSKPPLKRNIAPLIIKNKNEWNGKISSPISSDQDYSTQPLSVTLPNLVIDSPKDDEPNSGGGRVPRQYSSTPKQYEGML